MKVIGITGGVGAGKSQALRFLKESCGARVIQADQVGHLVMEPGTRAYEAIVKAFGQEILGADGRIDRGRLGAQVFADKKKRETLNAVIHPAVKAYIREELAREREQGETELFVIEAALLIEDHYETICEELWYLYARPEVRRERLKASRGYSDEKIDAILKSQLSDAEFRRHCPVVIDNNGSLKETQEQIRQALRRLEADGQKDRAGDRSERARKKENQRA